MFNININENFSWGNVSRRRATPVVKTGCFVLEHVPTGKLYTGTSLRVSDETRVLMEDLRNERFLNHAFLGSAKLELDIRVYEYPAKSMKEARALESAIQASVSPNYLLTNNQSVKGKKNRG